MKKGKTYITVLFVIMFTKLGISQHERILDERDKYVQSFITETRSPLQKEDLQHLRFYAPSLEWIIPAEINFLSDTNRVSIPTYSGRTKYFRRVAILSFNKDGKQLQLSVFESLQGTNAQNPLYFIPFKDYTNGEETYGGGRYLDIEKSKFSTQIVEIDFNTAYNPWCAYADGYSCPIPPEENNLNIAVAAGEKNYSGVYKSPKSDH